MNATGRQTAPPQHEVVLVTFRACAPEASVLDFEIRSSAPLRVLRSSGSEVCHPLANDFADLRFRSQYQSMHTGCSA